MKKDEFVNDETLQALRKRILAPHLVNVALSTLIGICYWMNALAFIPILSSLVIVTSVISAIWLFGSKSSK